MSAAATRSLVRARWFRRPLVRRSLFLSGWLAVLLLLAMPGTLSGQAAPSADPAPITLDIPVFAGGYGTGFYEETARAFERVRPGVRINLYGDPRISDKLRVRIIDGHLPDAMLPFNLLIPTLAQTGRLLDLGPALAGPNWEGDARWGDTFLPGATDAWKLAGRRYGVPVSYACWVIYYNQRLFREHGWSVPRTWDEFFALCDQIQAAGIAPMSLTGLYSNYPDALLRAAYYNLAGADAWQALNELAPGARTDPRYVRAAAVLQRITQHYTVSGWEGATHTAAQMAFLNGRAALCVSGSWMLFEMGAKVPADFEAGVMNFPVFPEGVADPTTVQSSSDNFFVFATGDRVREQLSVDFLRFLTSRERALAWVRRLDTPSAVRGVPMEAYSPRMQPVARMIDRAREAFNMPQVMLQPPSIRQALIDGRLELMTGRISPEAFGRKIEAAAENDRARQASPGAVNVRHPLGATILLGGLAALVGFLLYDRIRRRRDSFPPVGARQARGAEDAATLGTLPPSRAAGFVAPAFALYAALVLAPGAVALAWAFSRWDGLGPRAWAGWFNFKWLLFESDTFWAALRNNAFLMAVPAAVVLPLALGLAYVLHRGVWGAGVLRALLLFPNLLGGIAAALLWMTAYEPHGGLVNAGLVALGEALGSDWLRSFEGYPWLAPRNLYSSLVPIYVWMACGFNLVLYLAAMEGIPAELYEVAEIEGASRMRQFFSITLPLIWEVVVISAVFIVIAGLNAFEMIWLLTQQDPDSSTHTLGTLMVSSMFKEFDIGRATAIAAILFVLVLAGSAGLMRGLKRDGVES